MTIDVEEVKKINLGPYDILWVKLDDDVDAVQLTKIRDHLKKMLVAGGKNNQVLVTAGEVQINVIHDPLGNRSVVVDGREYIKAPPVTGAVAQCDCGGDKAGTGHAGYCSTLCQPRRS